MFLDRLHSAASEKQVEYGKTAKIVKWCEKTLDFSALVCYHTKVFYSEKKDLPRKYNK